MMRSKMHAMVRSQLRSPVRLNAKSAVAAALLGLTMSLAHAQDLKIAYVNSERVLREANMAKAAQTKLEAEFGKRKKEIDDLAAKLKVTSDKLDKESVAMAESERARRQRELLDMDRDLQRRNREFQEDLNQRKNEELAGVVERANKVIKQIFDQEKYDLILQEVVFAGPRVDITKKVIDALNAGK